VSPAPPPFVTFAPRFCSYQNAPRSFLGRLRDPRSTYGTGFYSRLISSLPPLPPGFCRYAVACSLSRSACIFPFVAVLLYFTARFARRPGNAERKREEEAGPPCLSRASSFFLFASCPRHFMIIQNIWIGSGRKMSRECLENMHASLPLSLFFLFFRLFFESFLG